MISFWTLPATVFFLLQYHFGKKGLAGIHRRIFKTVLDGLKLSLLEEEASRFLDVNLSQLVSKSVAQNITSDSAILSSSPAFLVSQIAHRLGVTLFAGTEYAIDKRGCLCDIRFLVTVQEKLEIARLWCNERNISPQITVAWSDSLDDLPLLNWAGKVIAVRPTRALKKVAKQNRWQIWNDL